MAWSETNPMKERVLFISDLESSLYTMTELCERYGISRKTGYKWAARYVDGGVEGLKDQSCAPKSCPHRTDASVAEALLAARRAHPTWGPRKILAYLSRREPGRPWPAASTAGDIFKRAGLVKSRPRRRRRPPRERPKFEASLPNDLWAIDFKGEFRTNDRNYCYPLTVTDWSSRYLLGCKGLPSTATAGARTALETRFRKYGLPRAIISDNGNPFSSKAVRGLSQLSVWWIKLGIEPLLIQPGHPEQNGRHERMHRTLKAETTRPPSEDMARQQQCFDAFRKVFNEKRPHEALGQRPPAELYVKSPRSYPERLPGLEYPGHFGRRRVQSGGEIN